MVFIFQPWYISIGSNSKFANYVGKKIRKQNLIPGISDLALENRVLSYNLRTVQWIFVYVVTTYVDRLPLLTVTPGVQESIHYSSRPVFFINSLPGHYRLVKFHQTVIFFQQELIFGMRPK
jgi:hypothetical protein